MKTPETQFAEWREHYAKQREELFTKRAEIDKQITEIDLELEGLRAYEQVKAGKGYHSSLPKEHKPRASSGPRAPRGAMGEIQKRIIAIVERYQPDGAKAEAIHGELEALDDAAKKPIRAALNRMKRGGVLSQLKAKAPYTLGPNAARAAHDSDAEPSL